MRFVMCFHPQLCSMHLALAHNCLLPVQVDTVGNQARDEFFITYHGEPLTPPMVLLVTNSLQYYLALNEVRWVAAVGCGGCCSFTTVRDVA